MVLDVLVRCRTDTAHVLNVLYRREGAVFCAIVDDRLCLRRTYSYERLERRLVRRADIDVVIGKHEWRKQEQCGKKRDVSSVHGSSLPFENLEELFMRDFTRFFVNR